MASSIVFITLLAHSFIYHLVIGHSDCFKIHQIRDSAAIKKNLDEANPAVWSILKMGTTDTEAAPMDLLDPVKRGGRAALVDLLDFMNKPKPKAEAAVSTLAKQGIPIKQRVLETVLYDEDYA